MIHPELERYRETLGPGVDPATLSPEERRARYRELSRARRGNPPEMESVDDGAWEWPGRTVRFRRFAPRRHPRGLVLYAHGGSFVVGDLDTHDGVCRRFADDLSVVLVAIDYRLAPEHPFPSGLEDVVEAVRELATRREAYGAAGLPFVVMGDSAGATLVTAACRVLRDEGLDIAAQALIYPTLGPEMTTDSAHVYGSGYFLELEHLRHDYRHYLGDTVDHTDPRVTPLLAEDLRGVPPAVVMVAECDPLRDEGVAYAGLLEHFGVPVEVLEARGMVHGFVTMSGVIEAARADLDDFASHVGRFVLPESH
ncbi:MAG: alpha/beta hydrolase fold domain-containing protein [Acidimicrobiaceae bacterium]|nr:alpha/beta hydrolase fold domain-containing protein [Acidimicrobiaceae bacterium]